MEWKRQEKKEREKLGRDFSNTSDCESYDVREREKERKREKEREREREREREKKK